MKDIILIEKNVHVRCEIELLLMQFQYNIINIKKQKPSIFNGKIVIINALVIPTYQDKLKYSLVIAYGIQPMHNVNNNFIYISYDALLENLQRILHMLNNPKLELAITSLYNETMAQYLIKKLNIYSQKSSDIINQKFTLNLIDKNISDVNNFINVLYDMRWMNESVTKNIFDILNNAIILDKKKNITNIEEITLTCLRNTFYISIKNINNTTLLFTINEQQKQKAIN